MELTARIKAILRRERSSGEESPLFCGSLSYDPASNKFHYYGKEIGLTITETLILCHLMRNAGQVATYSSLAEIVWGGEHPGSNDTLRVHIQHIREKLETDTSHPRLILTKPNAGYSLIKPE
jgi:DNA-binding response OmpR family regulator